MAGERHKPFPDGEFTASELEALGNCNALTNQEAKIVLRRFTDTQLKASKLWAPPLLAQKAIDYLEKVEAKTDLAHSDTVQRLRESVTAAGVDEFEMALLANLTPETAEEAMLLVPSLADERFGGEGRHQLQVVLDEILTLKAMQ